MPSRALVMRAIPGNAVRTARVATAPGVGRLVVRSAADSATPPTVSIRSASSAPSSINPFHVRFSQDSISANFKKGGSVQGMADALANGRLNINEVPPIRIVERNGKLYTLDNRRLEAFRRANADVPYRIATPEEVRSESWKFTTTNDGSSIRVRGE
jgi:hypothetical protein